MTLEKVTLGEGMTEIHNLAFNETGIKEIVIPDSVTVIAKKAFSKAKNLEKVSGGASLKEIGESAFEFTKSLKVFEMPMSVEKIGQAAFYMGELSQIYLPENLKELKGIAFITEKDKITDIYVPEKLGEFINEMNSIDVRPDTKIHVLKGSYMDENFEKYFTQGVKVIK